MRSRRLFWVVAAALSGLMLLATACGDDEAKVGTATAGSDAPAGASPEPLDEDAPRSTLSRADFRSVIFLHHSVGADLVEQGGVRQGLTGLGYEFYDHGYNEDGLTLADGAAAGRDFNVPDDNTDPDGLAAIFAQPLHDPPDNTLSHLLQYDVIAFKSCFPTSNIESDAQLAEYKSYYRAIRDRSGEYPNKIFIIITPPPEVPFDTDPEAAARARAFADWLISDEYLNGHPNIFTFDLFDLLADPTTNTLRPEYQSDEYDAHPNERANQAVGPLFVSFVDQAVETYIATSPTPTTSDPRDSSSGTTAQLIQPGDLAYLGAFRLPDGPEELAWEYGGAALAYYPDGDPSGPDDGYPGSLFGTGHDWHQYVSEISIPVPVISGRKNVADLHTASVLQDFQDIRGDLFGEMEIPRVGLEYLPAQGTQTTGKLYYCWAPHMGEGETNRSHGWSELDLSNPRTAGPWRIGEYPNYVTSGYIFSIPQAWADANTPGMYLATGRFRDGGQGARGPSLFAYGPWNEASPPAPGATLSATPLLLYTDVTSSDEFTLDNYHHSDEWSGGAWLTSGGKAAVIFVGTKGQGDCWYGNPDGPCLDCDNRGWWSDGFVGQMIFFDPADLAAVARGEIEAYRPQPYAVAEIDEYLYHIDSGQQKHHVGGIGFDRERGLLYVSEPSADGDKPLVHVWGVQE